MFGSLPRHHAFPGGLCVLPGPLLRVLMMPRATVQQTPPPELQEQTPARLPGGLDHHMHQGDLASWPPRPVICRMERWLTKRGQTLPASGGRMGPTPLPRRA